MRLFVAIEIDSEIRDRLSALISQLRPTVANVSWVRAEGLHITLKFLGNVQDDKRSAIESALRSVRAEPFSLAIAKIGIFPNPRSPRVLWAGIDSGSELASLAEKVDEVLSPLGFQREKRGFSPHVTLARFKNSKSKPKLDSVLSSSSQEKGDSVRAFGTMAATCFYLYESKLSPQGASYSKLASFELEPGY